MPRIEHAPGCVLDPVHWLRHAIAASGRLVFPQEDEVCHVDRLAAEQLLDTLAHLAELPDWAPVTLEGSGSEDPSGSDVVRNADVPDTRFPSLCTCRVGTGSQGTLGQSHVPADLQHRWW